MASHIKTQLTQISTSAGGTHRDLAEKYKVVLEAILKLGEQDTWFIKEYCQPLITDGWNCCKWTGSTVGSSKSFIMVKISGQNFGKLFSDG